MTQPPSLPAGTPQGRFTLADEQATARLAQAIASQAARLPGLRIYLYGDLGAGKTTFVRLLLRALGVQGRIKSPTYALVESYELPNLAHPASHFDLYRLETPQEWQESGLQEELLAPGLRLVEWPQKAGGLLPDADLSLLLGIPPATDAAQRRELQIITHSPAGHAVARHALQALQ